MQHDKAGSLEGNTASRQPVQAFDCESVIERLRGEKTCEDHGRSVLILAHEPSLRLALTVIAAERRVDKDAGFW